MKYRELGKTGLKVAEIGFGAWPIGGEGYGDVPEQDGLEALHEAWERGVNFYDTADTYGSGRSEQIIAKFLKGKPREEIILASKVGFDFYHGGVKKNLDPSYIRFACEESLKRLGTEVIDVYQLHNPRLDAILKGDALGELARLKKEGKIRFIGVSVFTEEEALSAIKTGAVDTLQVVFNLLDQRMATSVFPKAKESSVGIIAREPLAKGMLTEKYTVEYEFQGRDHRRGWSKEKIESDLKKVEKLRTVFKTDRISLVRAALEYVLEFEEISVVIPGAKNKNQVKENLLATEDPQLRSQEASQLRTIYQREPIFQKGFDLV